MVSFESAPRGRGRGGLFNSVAAVGLGALARVGGGRPSFPSLDKGLAGNSAAAAAATKPYFLAT